MSLGISWRAFTLFQKAHRKLRVWFSERKVIDNQILSISHPSMRADISGMSLTSINSSAATADGEDGEEGGTGAGAPMQRTKAFQSAAAHRLFSGGGAAPPLPAHMRRKPGKNAKPQAGSLPLTKGLVQVNGILDWGPERLKMRATMKTM